LPLFKSAALLYHQPGGQSGSRSRGRVYLRRNTTLFGVKSRNRRRSSSFGLLWRRATAWGI